MKFTNSLLLIGAAQVGEASAWWDNGHLLVSRIASDILTAKNPAVLAKVEDILAVLAKSDPSYTEYEKNHPFVECATFADKIKYRGGAYQSGWHFIDTPFLDEGGSISDYPEFVPDVHDVTEAIDSIKKWMAKEDGYNTTYIYETIMAHGQKGHTEDDALSTAVRLLIHYTGDIHQPLHATSRVDKEYPAGDRGGNSVAIPSIDGAKNLHAIWDSVVYAQPDDFTTPFSDADWAKIGAVAADLVSKHPATSSDLASLDPKVWAQDSFAISKDFLYKTVTPGDALSQDYVAQAQVLAEQQIVIGGTRLANLMISIFGSSTEEVSKFL